MVMMRREDEEVLMRKVVTSFRVQGPDQGSNFPRSALIASVLGKN